MQKVNLVCGVMLVLAIIYTGCNNSTQQLKTEGKMEQQGSKKLLPTADKFVNSPLRNKIELELNASVSEVWALVGNPGRMPEYSSGLRKVDTKYDSSGKCTGYTCYFLPEEEGGLEMTHGEIMRWYEPNKGFASSAEETNTFGFEQSIGLITLTPKGNKTILKWDIHFNSENEELIKMNVSVFEQSLNNDIAQNLIKKFGGRVLENYVEGKK